MAVTSKDTIYIDIDDEITGIIDKLKASDGKVVALVLPKRAAVFQSVVNMKLLKRAADEAKKHVVLITSEAGLLPLAGMVGIYIAKSLTSKPEIPLAPSTADDEETVDEPTDINGEQPEFDPKVAGAATVGALAGMEAAKDDVETVQLDDNEVPTPDVNGPPNGPTANDSELPAADEKPKKQKKDKSLLIPNFERFRMLLVIVILVIILLIAGAIFGLNVLPKAAIAITTNATNVNVSLDLNLSTSASSLDPASDTVPATLSSQSKTYNQQVATTGQQNEGNTASGTVTMSAGSCSGNIPNDIPQGTALTNNNLTFILSDVVSFIPTASHGHCTFQGVNSNGDPDVGIQAQSPGTNYNTSGSYSVVGNPNVSASGSTSGGTDNIVQIVSQNDINNAKAKLPTADPTVKQNLQNQLEGQGLYPIPSTFSAGTPTYTNSANVGTAASNVTVTEAVTYTMFGVHKSDLQTLVDTNINGQIDTSKQSILNDGIDSAAYSVQNASSTGAQISMTTTAEAGPELNVNAIKSESAGKKSGDIKSQLETDPDVTNVNVKLSPFWVTTVPKNQNKITVTIAKPQTTSSNNNANNP